MHACVSRAQGVGGVGGGRASGTAPRLMAPGRLAGGHHAAAQLAGGGDPRRRRCGRRRRPRRRAGARRHALLAAGVPLGGGAGEGVAACAALRGGGRGACTDGALCVAHPVARRVSRECVELHIWWSHLWQADDHITNRISAHAARVRCLNRLDRHTGTPPATPTPPVCACLAGVAARRVHRAAARRRPHGARRGHPGAWLCSARGSAVCHTQRSLDPRWKAVPCLPAPAAPPRRASLSRTPARCQLPAGPRSSTPRGLR